MSYWLFFSTYRYSNVDMRSQEAYEKAAQGLLGPEGKSVPILTGLRCVHFEPPSFTIGKWSSIAYRWNQISLVNVLILIFFYLLIEVQCLNETQKYLRKVVHEIGLELRSTAVCKGVRRTRDGPFMLQDALIHHHWTATDIMQAIRHYHSSKKDINHSHS